MSDSVRERVDGFLREWVNLPDTFDDVAQALTKRIESEINQARLAEAERAPHGNDCLSFNYDRSATGFDCSCARGKRIAQLSSVQQEAPKPRAGAVCGCGHAFSSHDNSQRMCMRENCYCKTFSPSTPFRACPGLLSPERCVLDIGHYGTCVSTAAQRGEK